MRTEEKDVFIIGSKGIPAKYGGFETFVDELVCNKKNNSINYYVSCMQENSEKSNITSKQFVYHNANCFNIKVPKIGPARAILYDILSLNYSINIAKKTNSYRPIFYVLACRIGPFIPYFKKRISKLGGKLFVNPDGHEWLREKWNKPTRIYWKASEKLMIKSADLVICDSESIEKYILETYKKFKPKTTYIAYGTNIDYSYNDSNNKIFEQWLYNNKLARDGYYLVVGRFVPENNYEAMITEFIKSKTERKLVIVTNVKNNKFYKNLLKKTSFDKDARIKFVGTVYDQKLLMDIRKNAFGYIHGHKVGGTNPSLLEAMATTNLNLLYDVGFNKEVGGDAAQYWKKNSLSNLINRVDNFSLDKRIDIGESAKKVMLDKYTWEYIIDKYEETFLMENGC